MRSPLLATLLTMTLVFSALWKIDADTIHADTAVFSAQLDTARFPWQHVFPEARTLELSISDGNHVCLSAIWRKDTWLLAETPTDRARLLNLKDTLRFQRLTQSAMKKTSDCRHVMLVFHGRFTPQWRTLIFTATHRTAADWQALERGTP